MVGKLLAREDITFWPQIQILHQSLKIGTLLSETRKHLCSHKQDHFSRAYQAGGMGNLTNLWLSTTGGTLADNWLIKAVSWNFWQPKHVNVITCLPYKKKVKNTFWNKKQCHSETGILHDIIFNSWWFTISKQKEDLTKKTLRNLKYTVLQYAILRVLC